MEHIHRFADFINESRLNYQSGFLAIIKDLAKSSNEVVKEVALLLLNTEEFESPKFKRAMYHIETDKNDLVLFDKQPIKLGRLLVSFLPDVPLFKIEQFVQVYKGTVTGSMSKYRLELYSGQQILAGYTTGNYAREISGDLYSSCMNDDFSYLALYTDNDSINLAVCLDTNNKICARTLVWECTDGKKYHDRIYSITAENKEALSKLLAEKGIVSIPDETLEVLVQEIPEEFPYVDTFRYLDETQMTLSNSNGGECKVLNQTDGTYEDSYGDFGDVEYEDDVPMRSKESAVFDYIEQHIDTTISYVVKENCATLYEIVWDIMSETKDPEEVKNAVLYKMQNELNNMRYRETANYDFIKDYAVEFAEGDEKLMPMLTNDKMELATLPAVDVIDYIINKGGFRKMEELWSFVVERLIEEEGLVKAILDMSEVTKSTSIVAEVILAQSDLHTIATTLKEYMGSEDIYQYYDLYCRRSRR